MTNMNQENSTKRLDMTPEQYLEIIKKINDTYGTTAEVEHRFIHEFFEGSIPVFKLILSKTDEAVPGIMIVSFHLDTAITTAIQWFVRLRQLDVHLHITGSYIKNGNGETYVGEEAELFKMYSMEQAIIAAWNRVSKPESNSTRSLSITSNLVKRITTAADAAIAEFEKNAKNKDDTFH